MANNDYRLGNWVILHGKTCQITGILKGYFNVNDECYEDDKGEFQPVWYGNGGVDSIPLTPELLVKIGFEQESRNSRTLNYGVLWLRYNGESFEFAIGGDFHAGETHMFRYVHELQNLYRAVTGEELPIEITA